ncbi:MAG: transcriptional regulator [Candidatus Thorarchaeota archaeon]
MTKARTQLTKEVIKQLEASGFSLSDECDVRPSCFDLVARRGEKLILVKILTNINALSAEDAMALQLVAHFFNATPLIVGQKTGRGNLDPGVVYKRYGVSTIAPSTFQRMISEEVMPREFSQKGGRYVALDGRKLREARLEQNLSSEELARCVQVSARAILAYENNEIEASTEVAERLAQRLERVLETDLMIPIDLLTSPPQDSEIEGFRARIESEWSRQGEPGPDSFDRELEQRVNRFFERLGMKVLWTDRAPFHVAAKEKGPPLISGVGSIKSWALRKRMSILKSVSEITESDTVIIVEEGEVKENVASLPVIRQLELESIEKPQELKKIIAERSEQV